jgi:hypothetical protein
MPLKCAFCIEYLQGKCVIQKKTLLGFFFKSKLLSLAIVNPEN